MRINLSFLVVFVVGDWVHCRSNPVVCRDAVHRRFADRSLGKYIMVKKSKEQPTEKDVTDDVNAKRHKLSGRSLDEKLTEQERKVFYDHSSERAMAIVLGAIVENHLTDLLRLLMRRERQLADELFNPTGPLGAFGTKIRIAYMFRIISPETYNDLKIINRIRNSFAHDLSISSFEDQQIAAWIRNMYIYGIVKKMGEDAKGRLEKGESLGRMGKAADFIKSNALLSSMDSYRDCLRYVIHSIIDYKNSIELQEAELNQQKEVSVETL
jgi:DNA-binding MltR family transcriptional regulator